MKKHSFFFMFLFVGYTLSHAEQMPNTTKQSPKQSVIQSIPTLTNPFKHSTTQNLELQAIINNKALLNGQWHKLGDVIDGYTITTLHSQGIILQKLNTRFSLPLNGTLEQLEP